MEYPIEIDVIFVDDDREICSMMKDQFYKWGLRYFKIFSDVHEAVEYCLSQDLGIAIFIVDYNLGRQSGLFFLDKVRRKFPNAYLDAIILSGECGAHFNDLCASAGVKHVLEKPIKLNELSDTILSIAKKYEPFLDFLHYGSSTVEQVIKAVAEKDRAEFLKDRSDRTESEMVSPPSKEMMTSLLEQTGRLSGLVAQLGDMGHSGTIRSLVHKIIKEAKHCSIFAGLFYTMFHDSVVEFSDFDVNKTLKQVLGITAKTDAYQLRIDLWEACMVRSDKKLVEQVLFVFLSYINDYFFGEQGELSIRNGIVEGDSRDPMQEEKLIEFQFQISDCRSVSKEKKRILIVDDEEAMTTYIGRLFIEENFEIHTVATGHDCLDYIADNSVDLVILDIRMMGMQGTEVLQKLRTYVRCRNVPVILYSRHLEAKNIADAIHEFDIYHPVRLLSKSEPNSVLLKLSKELLRQELKYDNLEKLYSKAIDASIKSDPVLRIGLYPVRAIAQQLPISISFQESAQVQTIRIGFKPAVSGVTAEDESGAASRIIKAIRTDLLREVYRVINHVINGRVQLIRSNVLTLKNKHAADIQDIGILDEIESVIEGFAPVLNNFTLKPS